MCVVNVNEQKIFWQFLFPFFIVHCVRGYKNLNIIIILIQILAINFH